ncbi:hypothetical protein [Halalkalibacter wakoensis]|nr:hypothetical protein [Halalkalibacter wakoensis]
METSYKANYDLLVSLIAEVVVSYAKNTKKDTKNDIDQKMEGGEE